MNAMSATRPRVPEFVRVSVPVVALVAVAALAPLEGVRAEAFESLERLDQAEFLQLSENLAAATHYKAVTPAESLGILGFDVGVEISSTEIDRELFDRASDGDYGAGSILVPRVHAHKGLPFGIDVGAFVGAVPQTDLSLFGAELRLALVEGGVAFPAVALRASYSSAFGSNSLQLDNAALELTVSKGFLMLTPYAGVGIVHSESKPGDTATLADESVDQEKLFAGVNVNLVGLNVTAEADRTGEYTSFSAKLGFRF